MRLFRNDREAFFESRPSRFTIIARDGDERFYCHCPNPGRLMEFTFPGEKLILERREGGGGEFRPKPAAPPSGGTHKTAWTAAAVYYNNAVVPLHAARANAAALELVLPVIIPGMKNLRAEYRTGSSRFDFYCEDSLGHPHLVEVKACSLVEHGIAMFPDAPSARALKHLEKLAERSRAGFVCHIVFVILQGRPGVFVPNLHTDPAFAAALSRHGTVREESGKVRVHAALLESGAGGETVLVNGKTAVDLSWGEFAEKNSGSYLFILELEKARDIETGALGRIAFKKGWYVYAGSAAKNLEQRVARHLRRTGKQKHWHIDFLAAFAGKRLALPVRARRNLECALAGELRRLGGEAVPRFGCSDCACGRGGGSHLYRFGENPAQNREFITMLLRFRHVEAFA